MSITEKLRSKGVDATKRVLMSAYTTFKTGGYANIFIRANNTRELLCSLDILASENLGYTVVGMGSNILVSDDGYKGAVLQMCMADIAINDSVLYCGAGAKLSSVANFAINSGFCGLEFAAGIPGTVGGGVYMNAGAYGGELSDKISRVYTLKDGKEVCYKRADMEFSYRHSPFMRGDEIITAVEFALDKGDVSRSKALVREYAVKRKTSQPLEFPSAGSTFKRPPGHYAGALIEGAGLKGFAVGGAQVSNKHAGFIINTGSATSADIYALMCAVVRKVEAKYGVTLEREVRLLGEFHE